MEGDVERDVSAKYIFVLEERRQLSEQLSAAQRQLRTATDKLHSVVGDLTAHSALVAQLKQELATLQGGLDREAEIRAENEALKREAAALKARGATTIVIRRAAGSDESLTGGSRGAFQSTKRGEDSPTSSTAAGTRSSKRLRTSEDYNMDVDQRLEAARGHSNQTIVWLSQEVDNHVTKTGTGPARVIRCNYCTNPIISRDKSRWVKHVARCEQAPESVKALMNGERAQSFSSDQVYLQTRLDTEFMDDETRGGEGTDDPLSIDNHVTKTGTGPARVIRCIHCKSQIKSDRKAKWVRHMHAHCPMIPPAIKATFRGYPLDELEKNAMEKSVAPSKPAYPVSASFPGTTYSISSIKTNARRGSGPLPTEPGIQLLPAAPAKPHPSAKRPIPAPDTPVPSSFILRPWPTPTPPYLPDGTKNTLGFRAWQDIVRYQRPGYKITNACGLKMTYFKKMYSYPEVRMVPETSTSKFSSGCFAIPESLHAAFMEHFNAEGKYGVNGGARSSFSGRSVEAGWGSVESLEEVADTGATRDGSHDSTGENFAAAIAKPAEEKKPSKGVEGTRYNA
ncbi:hypothetical protein BC830DRAFT_477192 [Chytriomyces sp. MP71]|nr:hypothetical protein BC830DRAFT_477192 [Chytriomyces sp. MP71]